MSLMLTAVDEPRQRELLRGLQIKRDLLQAAKADPQLSVAHYLVRLNIGTSTFRYVALPVVSLDGKKITVCGLSSGPDPSPTTDAGAKRKMALGCVSNSRFTDAELTELATKFKDGTFSDMPVAEAEQMAASLRAVVASPRYTAAVAASQASTPSMPPPQPPPANNENATPQQAAPSTVTAAASSQSTDPSPPATDAAAPGRPMPSPVRRDSLATQLVTCDSQDSSQPVASASASQAMVMEVDEPAGEPEAPAAAAASEPQEAMEVEEPAPTAAAEPPPPEAAAAQAESMQAEAPGCAEPPPPHAAEETETMEAEPTGGAELLPPTEAARALGYEDVGCSFFVRADGSREPLEFGPDEEPPAVRRTGAQTSDQQTSGLPCTRSGPACRRRTRRASRTVRSARCGRATGAAGGSRASSRSPPARTSSRCAARSSTRRWRPCRATTRRTCSASTTRRSRASARRATGCAT